MTDLPLATETSTPPTSEFHDAHGSFDATRDVTVRRRLYSASDSLPEEEFEDATDVSGSNCTMPSLTLPLPAATPMKLPATDGATKYILPPTHLQVPK